MARTISTRPDRSFAQTSGAAAANLRCVSMARGRQFISLLNRQNTTTYQYNARDLVSEIDYADSTTKAFTYCGCCGRLKTITDQNGSVVTNTYNDAGVLTQRDISRGTGVVGTTGEIFTVDGAYRRTRAENKDGSTTISVCEYHYNTLDWVDQEKQTRRIAPTRRGTRT